MGYGLPKGRGIISVILKQIRPQKTPHRIAVRVNQQDSKRSGGNSIDTYAVFDFYIFKQKE